MGEAHTFVVKKAPEGDIGLGRVRVHYRRRQKAPRFSIFKLSDEKQIAFRSVLGHDGDESEIQMDVDLRNRFNVDIDDQIKLTLSKAWFCDKLKWYLTISDPAIRIPAWLALWSVLLGGAGLVLSVISLAKP